MEFLAIKTLVCCSVQFSLVDVTKPLILSSDASFSAYGGLAQQYTETPYSYSPQGPVLTDTDHSGYKLVTVGAFSRGFSRQFLVRAIVYKELAAFLKCLNIFNTWVVQCPATIFFTDCIAISYLAILKNSSSKLATFAAYL